MLSERYHLVQILVFLLLLLGEESLCSISLQKNPQQ